MDRSPLDDPLGRLFARTLPRAGCLVLIGWAIYFAACEGLPTPYLPPPERRPPLGPTPGDRTVPALGVRRYLDQLRSTGTDVQKDFANEVFGADDPVEKLLARHKPDWRITTDKIGWFLFRPPESRGADGQTLLVISQDGKLHTAVTRVVLATGESRVVCFFPVLPGGIAPWHDSASEWESLERQIEDGIITLTAAFGGPGVAGLLLGAGWRAE